MNFHLLLFNSLGSILFFKDFYPSQLFFEKVFTNLILPFLNLIDPLVNFLHFHLGIERERVLIGNLLRGSTRRNTK